MKHFFKLRSDYEEVTDGDIMALQQNITKFLDSIFSVQERIHELSNLAASSNIHARACRIPIFG